MLRDLRFDCLDVRHDPGHVVAEKCRNDANAASRKTATFRMSVPSRFVGSSAFQALLTDVGRAPLTPQVRRPPRVVAFCNRQSFGRSQGETVRGTLDPFLRRRSCRTDSRRHEGVEVGHIADRNPKTPRIPRRLHHHQESCRVRRSYTSPSRRGKVPLLKGKGGSILVQPQSRAAQVVMIISRRWARASDRLSAKWLARRTIQIDRRRSRAARCAFRSRFPGARRASRVGENRFVSELSLALPGILPDANAAASHTLRFPRPRLARTSWLPVARASRRILARRKRRFMCPK